MLSRTANLNSTVRSLPKKVQELNTLMAAVVLVTFLGFITLLVTVCGLVITYQNDNKESYQEYTQQLELQNKNIEDFTAQVDSLTKALEETELSTSLATENK
ncbi:MAG TPA: hypothetical protein VD735_03225 [Candidatus Saccharimonadales bacterium]|nr:hypothetical protein [Candidatus Saccharimonadales bacterium]